MHCRTCGIELRGRTGGEGWGYGYGDGRELGFVELDSLVTHVAGDVFELMAFVSSPSPQLDAKIFVQGDNVFNTAWLKNIAWFDR
jgi:hypothetical protein